jgi:hypothetical protein
MVMAVVAVAMAELTPEPKELPEMVVQVLLLFVMNHLLEIGIQEMVNPQ